MSSQTKKLERKPNKCAVCEKPVYFDEGSVIMEKKEVCVKCVRTIRGERP